MIIELLDQMPHGEAAPIAVVLATAKTEHIVKCLNQLFAGQVLTIQEAEARLKLVPATIRALEMAS